MKKGREDWSRVAEAVELRRAELGLRRQQDAADRAGIGVTTWRQIEGAKQEGYSKVILAAVATALEWPADMLVRIARGEDPPRISTDDLIARYDEEISSLRDALADVQEQLDRIQGEPGSPPPGP